MSHGRHRLFDAKRCQLLVRIMVGPNLRILHDGELWWPAWAISDYPYPYTVMVK